jgi:hypothetical protein
MLPQTIALSTVAAAAIRDFVADGGVALADGEPGLFDEHGRRLREPQLARLFDAGHADQPGSVRSRGGRAIRLSSRSQTPGEYRSAMAKIVAAADIAPPFPVTGADGKPLADVETRVFEDGAVTVLALQRDFPGSGEASRPRKAESPEDAVVVLPRSFHVYDIRTGWPLGKRDRLAIPLDAVAPTIFALSERPFASPEIVAPASARPGADVELELRGAASNALDVIRVDVLDPAGHIVDSYSRNIFARRGSATMRLPLAVNDEPGAWTIRARDALSGAVAPAVLIVGN